MITQVPDTLPLIPILNEKLIQLLRNLTPEQWELPTIARKWKVKDIAAHLIDVNIRRIGLQRDNWNLAPDRNIGSYSDLVGYLNDLNADWVKAMRRLSPPLLIDWLQQTNEEVLEVFKNLDPQKPAIFSVAWAGEEVSTNAFDIAREYTERWHHQQQIRDAIGDTSTLMTKGLYKPLLDIFMFAWPYTLNKIEIPEGTVIKTVITGEGGGEWTVVKKNEWTFCASGENPTPDAETLIEGDIAWKLFTKSFRKEDIEGKFEIKGDEKSGSIVLEMISVMA